MDFYKIQTREIERGPRKGELELYPDFTVGRHKDLMVRGKHFYAVWDEEKGLWSTDEYDVQRLVDADLDAYAAERAKAGVTYHVKHMGSASSGIWYQFRKYIQNISDNSSELDENLTFSNTIVKKSDYVSRRLPYALEQGSHDAWDELVGTLYSVEERAKIEWAIGAIVSGDSKKIQKFLVLYGPGGTGKSTILNIVLNLFEGYTTTFEAKALGSNNGAFATEAFKDNPLVGIQQDGDLSRIDDNTRLNSIIAHEPMTMNEKYKASYTSRVLAFLWMGTNQPVKISDAKSGIIRRLIDVHPTGVRIPPNHYNALMSRIDFELGAISYHCLEVYRSMGANYYNAYRPLEMMLQTDIFFNYIEAYYDVFKSQDYTTLKQAYALYKEYCAETGIEKVQPQYKVREELRNYFDEFHDRAVLDGHNVRSMYKGFNASKFKTSAKKDTTFSLVIEESVSLLDEMLAEWPAQYSKEGPDGNRIPSKRWDDVNTTLSDLDTSDLHYVQVPPEFVVIDFDLRGVDGEKSLERNLEAASNWPATYAELSQGGNGVHLHYDYDGDVSELSAAYSDGIEVKTLLGGSSLRRRLTKCNNIPVATMAPGRLPIKERKVLSAQTIQSEKGLREQIQKNLRREIHPSTVSSVDFIKKILDDAHADGLVYDVTDMRGRIMAFANNSTNQSMRCLRTVQEMKWSSMDTNLSGALDAIDRLGAQPDVKAKDERLVFYDVEIYPNLFVVCWKYEGTDNVVRMINPSQADIEELLKFKLVGFYNRRYDNHILYAAFMGATVQELYRLSQRIIAHNDQNAMFAQAYGLSYADVWDFCSKRQTLKLWEIELGIKHTEMSLDWDKPVPPELIPAVVEYCCDDVRATEAVFENRKNDFNARQILAALSGLTVNDTTQKHAAKIVFGNDRNASDQFVYTDLSKEFPGYVFEVISTDKLDENNNVIGKIHQQISTYRGEIVGEGGYVYAEPGIYTDVALADINSMHPSTIRELNMFGPYTAKYVALLEARLAIKAGDYETARQMLDGKLAPYLNDEKDAKALADALKLALNIVYGLTSAKFDNPFRDIENVDNIVAKRGALFMIDLKHMVQEAGFTVAHIKTDSIKIPNATPEILQQVQRFGEKYGYNFEIEATYEKFCLVNDAVYIAREDGQWLPTGAQFKHPYVFKDLFSRETIEWKDYCETKSVIQGAMYLDFAHDKPMALPEGMQFIGRVGQFVPVTEKSGGAMLYRVVDGKPFSVSGTKGHLWLEAQHAESLGDKVQIDTSYFGALSESAMKQIEKFGSYDEFVA